MKALILILDTRQDPVAPARPPAGRPKRPAGEATHGGLSYPPATILCAWCGGLNGLNRGAVGAVVPGICPACAQEVGRAA